MKNLGKTILISLFGAIVSLAPSLIVSGVALAVTPEVVSGGITSGQSNLAAQTFQLIFLG